MVKITKELSPDNSFVTNTQLSIKQLFFCISVYWTVMGRLFRSGNAFVADIPVLRVRNVAMGVGLRAVGSRVDDCA